MENQQQQNTPLCRANCGFYGSPATEDMCSKCFKDMIKRKQETGNTAPSTTAAATTAANKTTETLPVDAVVAALAASGGGATEQHRSTSSPENAITGLSASSGTTASTSHPGMLSCSAATTTTEATNNTNAAPSPAPGQQQEDTQQKKKPNRCGMCNKRVGLTGFECRCGGLFCGEHRYDSAHNCTFDYKTAGREELRAKHPQVITDKIERI
ncbi:hypothetical protein niasHS_017036 [Heterodera schachtii]|uniref:Zinc finger protein n=1 Tax=Heterodera schachtii TaxID=97005 RepID=A0ABD2HVG1_HETSC